MNERQESLHRKAAPLHSTDADLVRRARQGDETACHEMVSRYADYLYRLAFSLVGNAADAEDVLQETFTGAFRHLHRFEERAAIKTWLSRILVRQAARCHRSRWRHKMISLNGIAETISAASPGEGSQQDALDTRFDVMAVLATLAPIHREVIVLRELHGMSYEDIAAALDVPRGTVESRLFRAREELKMRLRGYLP